MTQTKTGSFITVEKKKELEAELVELKGPKRRSILESLEYAKSLGDLSENAEYHQAREEQGKLEERIAKIESILQSAEVVTAHHGDKVSVGSTVVVKKSGDAGTQTYQIVGAEEADMAQGKISNLSPLGNAIYGKKKGDKFTFKTPGGEVNYQVVDVS